MSDLMEKSKPKVSVSLITYNHADFIAQAIESILMQETDFEYELVIGEDDSSDGTREIVKAYKEMYPNKIKLLLNNRENVIYIDGRPTGRWNLVNTLQQCRGQYIALIEGDDYWTDPKKLQKQVAYLDRHSDIAISFHSVWFHYDDEKVKSFPYIPPGKKQIYQISELLHYNFIATLSVLYRNQFFDEFPGWFYHAPVGDYPLHLLNALFGKIGYIDEVMGVRRIHDKGYWSSMNEEEKIEVLVKLRKIINKSFEDTKYSNIAKSSLFYSQSRYELNQRNNISALIYLIKCLILVPGHLSVRDKGYLNIIIEYLSPPKFYNYLRQLRRRVKSSGRQHMNV